MAYSFNQTFTAIPYQIVSALPGSLSSQALNIITNAAPTATQKDVLSALYGAVGNGENDVKHEDLYLFVLSQISSLSDEPEYRDELLCKNYD